MGFTSLNLLKDAIPMILANVICDADNGIANILNGKIEFKKLITIWEEKEIKIMICVINIAKAPTGFILDIWDPTLWAIFCENNKAPIPINNDPKKYNFCSEIINNKSRNLIFKSKYGE